MNFIPTFKRVTIATAIGGAAVISLGLACYAAGARINSTKSIPLGLYWTTSQPVEKGAYVIFCPPPLGVFKEARARHYIASGFCPGDYGYMMKRVLAAKGDAVTVSVDGVRVNGALLRLSKPIDADKSGRPLPRYQAAAFTLSDSQLLLMSDVNPWSFDGRYFGPIQRAQVVSVIQPVFTW